MHSSTVTVRFYHETRTHDGCSHDPCALRSMLARAVQCKAMPKTYSAMRQVSLLAILRALESGVLARSLPNFCPCHWCSDHKGARTPMLQAPRAHVCITGILRHVRVHVHSPVGALCWIQTHTTRPASLETYS